MSELRDNFGPDDYDHVNLDDPYYRDNLAGMFEALDRLGYGGTGDWFNEWRFRLQACGAEPDKGNETIEEMTAGIRRAIERRTE